MAFKVYFLLRNSLFLLLSIYGFYALCALILGFNITCNYILAVVFAIFVIAVHFSFVCLIDVVLM